MATVFNVIANDFNRQTFVNYDVLPYFREQWNGNSYNYDKDEVWSKKKLKKWILRVSQHRFWGRAQYEIMLAQWPFGSYKLTNDIKEFFAKNKEFDIDNYDQKLALYNIFTSEMDKIDIHYQVEMNIDVITDILYKEFKYRIWVNPIIDFFKKIFNKIKYGVLYK